jgi:hypothetical protein
VNNTAASDVQLSKKGEMVQIGQLLIQKAIDLFQEMSIPLDICSTLGE